VCNLKKGGKKKQENRSVFLNGSRHRKSKLKPDLDEKGGGKGYFLTGNDKPFRSGSRTLDLPEREGGTVQATEKKGGVRQNNGSSRQPLGNGRRGEKEGNPTAYLGGVPPSAAKSVEGLGKRHDPGRKKRKKRRTVYRRTGGCAWRTS